MIAELTYRILDHLQADFERQSGELTWDDVHQIVLGRSLAAADAVQVWQEAAARFALDAVRLPACSSPRTNGAVFLTATEERVLSRRAAAARLAAEADRLNLLPAELKRVICGMGKAALDRLVLSNTGLVGAAAAEFAKRATHLDKDDLFQEGIMGLIHAIEKFDPEKGYRLSTYATWWIRQHIQRAIDSKARIIRLPVNVVSDLRELKRKRARLRHSLGRPPTEGELAHELGILEGDVNLMLRVEEDAQLLNDIPHDPAAKGRRFWRKAHTVAGPLRDIEVAELSDLVHSLLNYLDRRSRFVIRQRFELEGRSRYTLQQLGERLHITRERVRQIEARSLARLARGKEAEALRNYLKD